MTINVTEFINKMQEDGLATIKQAQDQNLAALAQMREFATAAAEKPGEMPSFTNVPTPSEMVERSFDYMNRFLEVRKGYAMKMADIFADAQKQTMAEVQKTTNVVTERVQAAARPPQPK